MRVLADADIVSRVAGWDSNGVTAEQAIAAQLEHPLIEAYRYSPHGPPDSAEPVGDAPAGWFDGWAVVENSAAEGIACAVRFMKDSSATRSHVWEESIQWPGEPGRESGTRDDGIALAAAAAVDADVFVTRRACLEAAPSHLRSGVTICTPEDAAGVIGLYLRAQDDFRIGGRPSIDLGRWAFYWAGARDALPAAWRFVEGWSQLQESGGLVADRYLALATVQRLQRVLEARDQIHVIQNAPREQVSRGAILSPLDAVTLNLMGSLDALARSTHLALRVDPSPGSERFAGWQSRRWLKLLAKMEPSLASLAGADTPASHVLTVLTGLRNTIHGVVLEEQPVDDFDRAVDRLLRLPDDRESILESMRSYGGHELWGTVVHPHDVYVDPSVFVDRLIVEAIELLNRFMEALPLERLLDAEGRLPSVPAQTHRGGLPGMFSPWSLQHISYSIGLPAALQNDS